MPSTIRSLAQTHAVRVESRAIIVAAGAFLLSGLVGLLVMHGTFLPIWKEWSVGLLAIIVGVVIGAGAYSLSAVDSRRRARESGSLPRTLPRFIWDTTALTFTHVAILAMLGLVLFSTLQQAFQGLEVDTLTGTMMVALSGAASAYFLYLSAATTTANKMSTLLSVFLSSGILLSMTTTTDPHWWQANFSILGTTRDFSSLTFNLTLIITGATITILADYVTSDLAVWTENLVGRATPHIRLLKWALVAIGVLLACVGLVPVNQALIIHNTVATGMVVIFVVLMIALKRLLPGYPQTFFSLGYAFLICIGVAAFMFFPVGYYNLTAFELIASALIFSWLVIFVRNTAAVTAVSSSR
ncbi:hypothetical protein AB4Y63_17500 [Leifsonia sp. YAF41]|uniref:hypothetical protein n=1 Tax=Leifsonia sp. YAF41 TaxID=3233086 RepID=UPI003F96F215